MFDPRAHHERHLVFNDDQISFLPAQISLMQSPGAGHPSSLACLECRHRHLKCSGDTPACARCLTNGLSCNYTPSRRGRFPRTKRGSRHTPAATVYSVSASDSMSMDVSRPSTSVRTDTARPSPQIDPSQPDGTLNTAIDTSRSYAQFQLPSVDREHLIHLYYTYFHPAHPLLVPRAFYASQRYPQCLELVVCFIGHHYARPGFASTALYDATNAILSQPDEHIVARAQALVLYANILHARHQPKEAEIYIERAASIAISLGMNRPNFAREHAVLDSVREESLRRTWWEIYIVDAYLAALHRRSDFRSNAVTQRPSLPCSESLFDRGKCELNPPPLRLFEKRVFAETRLMDFSPYCYRIEAIQIVARVLALAASNDAQPDDIQAVDNAIAAWRYNLPTAQADVMDPSGEVDPMLFQAHLFVHCASIFLHFPRSDLPSTVPSAAEITCAKGYKKLTPTSTQHTTKAISASKEISNLAAIPWPIDKHSPFFTCGLILGCVVQLAAASVHLHSCGLNCLQQHRDRVVLMLGALKCLGMKWSLAQNAVNHLRTVADAIFTSKNPPEETSCNSVHDSGIDTGDLAGGFSWFDLFTSTEPQDGLAFFDSG